MRRTLLMLLALFAATTFLGCSGEEGHRARYSAERTRYWAERSDIRFALESNPDIRSQYAESAQHHVDVAAMSVPSASSSTELREDLRLIRGEALLRAGQAWLNAGRWENASRDLELAIAEAPMEFAIEAAWTLGDARLTRHELAGAQSAFAALFRLLLSDECEVVPSERFIGIGVRVAYALAEASEVEALRAWVEAAREIHIGCAKKWMGGWPERRVRYLDHRLSLAAGDAQRAIDELEAFENWIDDDGERQRAMLVRSELLASRIGDLKAARAVQSALAQEAIDPQLRSLARLRMADLMWIEGNVQEASVLFEEITNDSTSPSQIASAAESRLAKIQVNAGEIVGAIQAYRRITLRFGDTPAGMKAPMEIVSLMEKAEADTTSRRNRLRLDTKHARQQAADHYRRVLDLHPGDSRIGMAARDRLITVLVGLGLAEEALLECEQLYHVVGSTPRGLAALVRAGKIASESLDRPELAVRYWRRVVEDGHATRQGAEAEALLTALGATID